MNKAISPHYLTQVRDTEFYDHIIDFPTSRNPLVSSRFTAGHSNFFSNQDFPYCLTRDTRIFSQIQIWEDLAWAKFVRAKHDKSDD